MGIAEKQKSKTKFIIIGVLALVIIGLFAAKIIIENKAAERAKVDLTLLNSFMKLESAEVSASLFSRSVNYGNVVYSFPDAPGLLLRIGKISDNGMDCSTFMGNPGDLSTSSSMVIENLSIELDGLEKPLLTMEYYKVNDITYNYRDIRAMLLENIDTNILDLLPKLMPLMANYRTGQEVGRNMALNMEQLDLVDVGIAAFASSGQSDLNREATGFDVGVSNIQLSDITFTSLRSLGAAFNGKIAEISIHGLKYNYKEVLENAANFSEESDPALIISAAMKTLYDYAFDQVDVKSIEATYADSAIFKIESISSGPYTLKESGSGVVRNMSLKYGPMDIFSLAEIGVEKVVRPDGLIDLMNNFGEFVNDYELQAELEKDPYPVLNGLRIENFYLKNLNVRDMVKIEHWRNDIIFENAIDVKSALSNLFLSRDALYQLSSFTQQGGGSVGYVIYLLSHRPEGATFNSGFHMVAETIKQEDKDTHSNSMQCNIEEPSLFDTGFSINVTSQFPLISSAMFNDTKLENMDIFAKDYGWKKFATETDVEYTPTIRGIIADMNRNIPNATQPVRAVLYSVRDFLEQGGSINIQVNPIVPLPIEDLDRIANSKPEALGLTATHTPPAEMQ